MKGAVFVAVIGTVLILSVIEFANAATLHVNGQTGNDATSRAANSAANPWRTIGRAAWGSADRATPNPSEAAQPGDVVVVAAGVYDQHASGKARNVPLYNPVNNGSAGQPITFRADGRVTLQSTAYNGPVIGTYTRDHIVWDGFYIDEKDVRYTPDTGPVVVWDSDHVVIQNLEISGTYAPYVDNHPGIRLEAANHVLIKGNLVYGFGVTRPSGPERSRNSSGIQLYYSNHVVVEHNEIRDCGSGVFVKGIRPPFTMDDVVIRYNYIYNMGVGPGPSASGIILHSVTNAKVYQNLIRDSDTGIEIEAGDRPHERPVGVLIANNTLDNLEDGVFRLRGSNARWEKVVLQNNLVSGAVILWGEDVVEPGDLKFNHNNYSGFRGNRFAYLRYVGYGFDDWKRKFGNDTAAPASTTSEPRYVNQAGGDFRPCNGPAQPAPTCKSASPVANVGVDVLDLNGNGSTAETIPVGAYITGRETIGRAKAASAIR